MYSFIFLQCQRTVKMRVMPYCTLLLNFLEGEISGQSNICNPISIKKTKHILHFFVVQYVVSYIHIFPALLVLKKCFNMFENSYSDIWYLLRISTLRFALCFVDMAIAILCSTSAPWKQHLKRPFTAKPEMWVYTELQNVLINKCIISILFFNFIKCIYY